jgi:circadian clock protein KaiC
MITSETTTLGPVTEPLGGLSFVFHNVVLLRSIELESEIRVRSASSRCGTAPTRRDLRQFEVDESGFTVPGKLEGLTGILGWSALRAPEHPS